MTTPTTVLPAIPAAEIQTVTTSPLQSAARYSQRMCQSIAGARQRRIRLWQGVGLVAQQCVEEAGRQILPGVIRLADLRHAGLDLAGIAHAEVGVDAVPFLVELLQRALDPHALECPVEPIPPFGFVLANHD